MTIWWFPCVESSLVLLEEGVCYDQSVLLENSVILCPASFCTLRPNLPVTLVFLDFLLLHSSPLWWKGHVALVFVLEGLVDLHGTVNFSFFSVSSWGIDLDYCDTEWFCIGDWQRLLCHFWDCTQVLHFGLFLLTIRSTPFLLRDCCTE